MPRDQEAARAARRRHYERNKDAYIERAKAAKQSLILEVRALKSSTPCMDCGTLYPHYVMDFDHRPDEEKVADVNILIQRSSRRKVMLEIAKCDLVCSNCHRERTWVRAHPA